LRQLLTEIGSYAGLAAFFGLAVLILVSFTQGRDIRRLREWAGSAPERDSERKESTSAAASERAEEMRKLAAARDEEREAAELREIRRERREAGLPELTRSERLRASFDGGRSRFAEPGFLVAAFLVVVLIGGGVAYAVLEGFGGEDGAGGNGERSAGFRPSQVEVAVLNGTAVEGLAGNFGDTVESNGFQLGAVTNSSSSFEESVVMFKPQNGRAAQKIATELDIPLVQPMTSDIAVVAAGAPVAVVIGEDNASSSG